VRVLRRVQDAWHARKDPAAKKPAVSKRNTVPTHVVSVFMGSVSQLVKVPKGAALRFTMKVLGDKAKINFTYSPGGLHAVPCAPLNVTKSAMCLNA
jgi:hypothetical protein